MNKVLDAADALNVFLEGLGERFKLQPLELLAVVSTVLNTRLTEEALEERMAMQRMADALGTEVRKPQLVELSCHICGKLKGQPPERCNGHYEQLVVNPQCCRKHNMMGKVMGNCAGGAVVTQVVSTAALPEVTPGAGPEYAATEPGGTSGGAY